MKREMKAPWDTSCGSGLGDRTGESSGFGPEAVNQNDVTADRVPRAAGIRYLCHQEKEAWGRTPGCPGRSAMQCAEAGKPLIKFNHCRKCIYSFSVPRCCPLCRQDVGSRRLEEAPVSISNPFANGHQEKCSFLLRPTQGTFLRYGVS